MSNTDILNLPAVTALSGTEYAPVVQGGTTKRAKVSQFDLTGSLPGSAQDANTVFAGPASGSPDFPSFRDLVNDDLPTVDVSHGGSGRTSATAYAVLCGGTTSTAAHQSVASVGTTGQALLSNGASAFPTFQTLSSAVGAALTKVDDTNVTLTLGGAPTTALLSATSITAGWTGTLAATRGGTGFGSYTVGDIIYASTTTAFTRLNASTAGYHLQTNGAGSAPTWTGYLNPGASAVTRTWNAKASDFLSVKDFGAVGDGVTNDTAAIALAIAAMPAAGGGLYFPTGRYLVSSLTFNKPGLYFGNGYASVVLTSSATANVVTASADFVEMSQLRFEANTTRSAGAYVYATGNRFYLHDFSMEGALEGVRVNVTATATIANGIILNSVASTGIPIRVENGLDVTIDNIIADQASQTYAGVLVLNAGDVTISDCNLIHCGQAIFINPGVGQVVTSVWATMCFFDNSTRGGYVYAQTGAIARCSFVKCWFSSASAEGFRLETSGGGTANGIDFTTCEFNLNGGHGVSIIDTGITNVRLNGGIAAGNTGNGINVAANVGSFAVADMRIGNAYGLGANANGIVIAVGTSDNYTIVDNDLRGNTGANLTDGGSGTSKVIFGNLPTTVNAALPVAQGGTGLTSVTQGDILYASAANTLSALAKDTNATRYLSNTGTSNNPAWAQVSFSTGMTGSLTVPQMGTASYGVGFISFVASSVNFNSANTDTSITITLPTGFTRYSVNTVIISGASASLTTATCGVFTAAGAGGTAIVASGSAITVSTASEDTNNNMQQLTSVNSTTNSFTAATLYFRVQNPQGSAATGKVTVRITPVS